MMIVSPEEWGESLHPMTSSTASNGSATRAQGHAARGFSVTGSKVPEFVNSIKEIVMTSKKFPVYNALMLTSL
jgi:hypothetical protein